MFTVSVYVIAVSWAHTGFTIILCDVIFFSFPTSNNNIIAGTSSASIGVLAAVLGLLVVLLCIKCHYQMTWGCYKTPGGYMPDEDTSTILKEIQKWHG